MLYVVIRVDRQLCFRAYVEKYLLEKSRLVYQEHNER